MQSWEIMGKCHPQNFDGDSFLKAIHDMHHGLYKGFVTVHEQGENTHFHAGIILQSKPETMQWKQINSYFQRARGKGHTVQTAPLLCKVKGKGAFEKKLQQYYNYTIDATQHEGQVIQEPILYRFEPLSPEQIAQDKPLEFITALIFQDLTTDELDSNIDESVIWSQKTRSYALRNYEKLEKMITTLEEIRARRKQAALYKEKAKTYRPFQSDLCKILDTQNDRQIHCHYDGGLTGKNTFVDIERMRPDTLVLQNSQTKRIAYVWNPKKHKRIIFDVAKNGMEYLNTNVIEKLKNGTLFSGMHHPKMKLSAFKPKILILGNEQVEDNWTEDRLTLSTTNNKDYQLKTVPRQREILSYQ